MSIAEDLDKIFDAISNVTFDKPDKKISNKIITELRNVVGNDEEILKLEVPVVCQDFIEKWLQNLENIMKISVSN